MFFHYITTAIGVTFALGAIIGLIIIVDRRAEGQTSNATLWGMLVLLTVMVSYWGLGGFLLFDIDEAIFAEAAREMVKTGDYLTPSYNFVPRYDKPILIYWLMALSYKLFGVSEFSARFSAAFSGSLLVLFTFGFVKRVRGALPALFAALALLLNIGYFVYSHAAVTDITLCLLIGSSIYAFYLAIHTRKDRWIYCAWAAAALALLLKGLVGLFLPSAIAILYLLLSRNVREVKRFIKLRYILLFLLIAAPWHIAEFYVKGWEFFDSFVMKHQILRYTSGFKGKSGPFYYYVPIIAIVFYPWAAFIPAGIKRGVNEFKKGNGGLYLLSLIWFVFVLFFFSYAATKHPNYILPLLPSVAIMAGCVAAEYVQRKRGTLGKGAGIYIMGGLSALIAAALFALPFLNVKMDMALEPWFFFCLGALFLVNGLFSIIAWSRPLYSLSGMAVIMFLTLIFLRSTLITTASDSMQRALYDYGTYLKSINNVPHVITYEIHKPSVAFYAKRKVERISRGQVDDFMKEAGGQPVIIITSEKRYAELKRASEFEVIDRRGGYILISNAKSLAPVPKYRP